MNKNFRIITINGVRGIFAAIFVVIGLIAGFIISPGWVCMKLWNFIFYQSNVVAMMNLFQGIMLWLIVALSLYALNNRRALIGFGSYPYPTLSSEQINDIMERAKKSEAKIIKEFEEFKAKSELSQSSDNKDANINTDNQTEDVRK